MNALAVPSQHRVGGQGRGGRGCSGAGGGLAEDGLVSGQAGSMRQLGLAVMPIQVSVPRQLGAISGCSHLLRFRPVPMVA